MRATSRSRTIVADGRCGPRPMVPPPNVPLIPSVVTLAVARPDITLVAAPLAMVAGPDVVLVVLVAALAPEAAPPVVPPPPVAPPPAVEAPPEAEAPPPVPPPPVTALFEAAPKFVLAVVV